MLLSISNPHLLVQTLTRLSVITSYSIHYTKLYEEDNQRPIIIDWRSPVANLYYEGRIGEEQYETESGVITGELLRKRQYIIEEEKIKEIRDVDVTARDELLQASLHENHDHQLKDIVATIQAEQRNNFV